MEKSPILYIVLAETAKVRGFKNLCNKIRIFFSGAAPESVQIGKEYLCTGNNCNDLTGDSIDLSPPNPSGTSGPVDPDRLGFIHDVMTGVFRFYLCDVFLSHL